MKQKLIKYFARIAVNDPGLCGEIANWFYCRLKGIK